jgi:dienelactone hydrolase
MAAFRTSRSTDRRHLFGGRLPNPRNITGAYDQVRAEMAAAAVQVEMPRFATSFSPFCDALTLNAVIKMCKKFYLYFAGIDRISLPGRVAAMILLLCAALSSTALADEDKSQILETPGGVRFGLLGQKKRAAPAPLLFVFASDIAATLDGGSFNKAGRLLVTQGYLCVSLDLPCHGADAKPGETGLSGWRVRLERGENFLPDFLKNCSAVLDYLVAEGYADPKRVAACGTSRGGFIALHFAAAEPRVRAVAAFAPVTNLLALSEFRNFKRPDALEPLSLDTRAERFGGRSLWLCIGSDDQRVGTDDAIGFGRKVTRACISRGDPALVELHIMPGPGHRVHPTAHQEVAAWIAARLPALEK